MLRLYRFPELSVTVTVAQFTTSSIYGLSVTGKPLDKHLLAVGIGTSLVQPFFGRVWDRSLTADESVRRFSYPVFSPGRLRMVNFRDDDRDP